MMILSAVLLLFLASMLHGWYAGHAAVSISQAAYAFMFYRRYIAVLFALSLITGLGLLWAARGFWWTAGGAVIYFFAPPRLTWRLLILLKVVPPQQYPPRKLI